MQQAALFLLMYAVYPLWVLAGLLDWACHRRTNIESTGGIQESLMHWLMFGQIGVGMLFVAFCEVNAAVLAVVLGVFLVHEATVYVELRYAVPRRKVGPFEQMVHSVLELLPLSSFVLLAVCAWPQAQAASGLGGKPADWTFHGKREPWPAAYLWGAALAAALFNALPLAQESIACLRFRSRTRPSPAPR